MAHSHVTDYNNASPCCWLPAGTVVVLHADGRREIITPAYGRLRLTRRALMTAEAFALMLHTLQRTP